MKDLTDRQRETLELIRAHTRRHGFPPSRKELAKSLGLSHPSSADGHLTALQTKGWIELRPDTKRGIRLVGDADPPVPLVDLVEPTGEIAAGEPIVAESRIVDRIPSAVAEQFSPMPGLLPDRYGATAWTARAFATATWSPSARRRRRTNGDVVVARFGDEVTLKRFVRLDEAPRGATPRQPQSGARAEADRPRHAHPAHRRGCRRGAHRAAGQRMSVRSEPRAKVAGRSGSCQRDSRVVKENGTQWRKRGRTTGTGGGASKLG